MRLKRILVSLAVVSLLAVPGITWAASIAIETLLSNPSFELGADLTCPTGWTCTGTPPIGAGAYSPIDAHYIPVTDGIPGHVPNGVRAAYAPITTDGASGSLTQITSSTWQSGNSYSFTFWVGVPLTRPDGTTAVVTGPLGAVFVSLLTDGNADNFCGGSACRFDIAAADLPTIGHWKQFTYNPGITVFGGTIGIRLQAETNSANQEINWDMDVESTTPVPEPATMFLGGLGLIALGFAARRRLFGR